jgi:hypothetical protein
LSPRGSSKIPIKKERRRRPVHIQLRSFICCNYCVPIIFELIGKIEDDENYMQNSTDGLY